MFAGNAQEEAVFKERKSGGDDGARTRLAEWQRVACGVTV